MIAADWQRAPFDPGTEEIDRALCAFAERLTREPASMGRADVDELRAVGLTDRDVHDAAQVVAYFGYINRVADALGVDPEPEWGEASEAAEP
jgi:uncharacterized peroxidase-related enzyme